MCCLRLAGRLRNARKPRGLTSITRHRRSTGKAPRCSSTNLNLTAFGSRRTGWLPKKQPTPRARAPMHIPMFSRDAGGLPTRAAGAFRRMPPPPDPDMSCHVEWRCRTRLRSCAPWPSRLFACLCAMTVGGKMHPRPCHFCQSLRQPGAREQPHDWRTVVSARIATCPRRFYCPGPSRAMT